MPLESLIADSHSFDVPTFPMLSKELLRILTARDHSYSSSNLAKLSMPAETRSNGGLVAVHHGCGPETLGEGV